LPRIKINGVLIKVAENTSVAAAVMNADLASRVSVSMEPRGPLCGMGICFECRVTVNGVRHERGCLLKVVEGMQVSTDAV